METAKIYTLTCPITLEIRYVGKTEKKLETRLSNHIKVSEKSNTHKNNWIKSLLKKELTPIIELLDIVPEIEWQFWEKYWISQFKT